MTLAPLKKSILIAISTFNKPISVKEIAKETHIQFSHVLIHLRRLEEMGYVTSRNKGYYELTKRGEDVLKETGKIGKGITLGKRYALESCVGKGTYGEVWKATDKSLERTVAVKLLHRGIKDFEQLKTEGKALSALTHKNIVIVHDLDSDESNGWLVTEFVEGPSLHEYLVNKVKEGTWISLEEAIDIIGQCLEALEFAHDKNRVHGDIKPANIFVPKTGEIKLGDFGVAKILSGVLEEKEEYPQGYERHLGSSSYAAPETLNGQPRDVQSDLYSVGILAYVLLTGQHPFMHKSGLVPVPELIKSPTYAPPKPSEVRKDISEKYEKIVMRLLEKDKGKRYPKAREVLDEWREKIEIVQCPTCNAENPVINRFCGQCGSSLRQISEVVSEPEKDLSISFTLFTAGRSEDAIKLMQQSLKNNSNFAKGWAHLGYMLNHERRYEEAEDACDRSIKIDSEPSRPYQTRGFARSNLGKFSDAIEDFTKAFDRETDDRRKSMILTQRAYAKKLSGDFQDALNDATMALGLDETNIKAQRLIESLKPLVKTK